MKIVKIVLLLTTMATLFSCGGTPTQKNIATKKLKFPSVIPPVTITDSEAQRVWMVENFFSSFDFADTTFIGKNELKTALGFWAMLLNGANKEIANKAIVSTMSKAEATPLMHAEFLRLSEGYLGDPNSELRNDTLFIALLDYMITTPSLDSLSKIRPRSLKIMTEKNRAGQIAANFSWIDINGKHGSLHSLNATHTLLFFYTPGCETCKEIFASLDNEPLIKQAVDEKKLKLVAVYCDQEVEKWKQYAPNINAKWSNVMTDQKFKTEQPFAIRATPSIYLLDAKKRVLSRDAVSIYQIIPLLTK